jgi:regulatory protein
VNSKNTDPLQKARNYAFLLLKFRLRSEKELYQRLKRKKFEEGVIRETLSFLKDKAFIDDRLFTKTWIEFRIKRPLGLRRIKEELNLKGIAREVIDSEISATRENYREEDVVDRIARQKLGQLKGIDPDKAKRRLYAYLLRRGFSPEVVMDAVNRLCKRTS